ncbi:phage tail protein [Streptomyces nodosus]|uniref:phage tail protein n=1 Tax=Streptomyces nodosus TaxID=40318 RepID=UPI0038054124
MRRVNADIAAKKQKLAHHQPATAESRSAQDAAKAPPDDKEAQGKAANAEKMNAAKPGEFNKQAFIDAVNKAIEAQAPKNLDDADKFSKSGKADKIKDEVDGKVSDGKEASAKDIDTATKAPPDTSAAKDKKVTPMSPDRPPPNPGAPSAADAIPEKQPASVTDFSEGPVLNDQAMADAEVTEDQLAKGNERDFDQALSAKKAAEADSAKAPAKGKAAEAQQLSAAKAGAAASGAQAMNALTATRASAGKQVDGGKGETKSRDERRRAEVTAKLQKVYDSTKKDVEETLSGLDKKVDTTFTTGEKAARDAFTADHERRMKAYKDKRYSGWRGKARWVKDKFAGLPEEANNLYQEARKLYVAKMQTVISSVADIIGAELGRAKARIAKGRTELKAEVDKLPADLRQFGEDAAKDFAGKFDDLEETVNEKSEQLVQDLAQKYTAALNKVDEEIKKLQEANKGLIDKAKDAIVGVIKTINELKNLLLGILARAAAAITKIIKDPIGFLGNLVHAVGAGLQQFLSNIATHLQTGLVSWLLGTAVKAGLDLPSRFDLKGIIQLIASLLGLTWANIRSRITRKGVPDQAMNTVEQSVPVAKALATEGPAGATKEIQSEVGDLKSTILEDLKSYLIPTVIIAGITWILSLLNPASAFVRAVKGIIDIVTFIVNQGAQIVQFVNAVLDAVVAIANGGSAGVPKLIETALAASIPLLIGLLASLLGIGGLANKIKQVFHKVARPVNRAIDKIANSLAKAGRRLWEKLKPQRGGRDDDKDRANDSPRKKQDDLNRIVAALTPEIVRYVGSGKTRSALESKLSVWRRKYRLTSLTLAPDGTIDAKINPSVTINKVEVKDRELAGILIPALAEVEREFFSHLLLTERPGRDLVKAINGWTNGRRNSLASLTAFEKAMVMAYFRPGVKRLQIEPDVSIFTPDSQRRNPAAGVIGQVNNVGAYAAKKKLRKKTGKIVDVLSAADDLRAKSRRAYGTALSDHEIAAALSSSMFDDAALRGKGNPLTKTAKRALNVFINAMRRNHRLIQSVEIGRMQGVPSATAVRNALVQSGIVTGLDPILDSEGSMNIMAPLAGDPQQQKKREERLGAIFVETIKVARPDPTHITNQKLISSINMLVADGYSVNPLASQIERYAASKISGASPEEIEGEFKVLKVGIREMLEHLNR